VPDVTACLHPADVRLWVSLDVHKFSIVAATLPPSGGKPEVSRIETTERAIRRFIDRLGGPEGVAVCYEAGPGGFALWRLLTRIGVACDVVAPSLVPVRAGDRVKTDRRDAKKLVALHRAGLLGYVFAPTAETEGLRDVLRCRDDLRCARTAARQRVLKQLLRHGRIFRDGKTTFTLEHRRWINAQRPGRPARSAGARADADPPGRHRAPARRARRPARADRWVRALGRAGRDPDQVPRHLDPDGAGADLRDRRLRALQPPARTRLVAGHRPQRVLLRRPAAPRPHHQGRQPPRPPAADRGRLALPPRPPAPRQRPAARRARPGRPRCACITATATSPSTASAAPSSTSRSPANSSASCGPR
jgi:hypothetical protein